MNKFHNTKWYGFDSKKEKRRYEELLLMESSGLIKNLKCQQKFELIPRQTYNGKFAEHPITYTADFTYEENGELVVEDVKGFKTDVYRLKRKLFLYRYGKPIRES